MKYKKHVLFLGSVLAAVAMVSSCDTGPKSGYGFKLPDGDVQAGEIVFTKYACADCHDISGREDLREGVDPIRTVPIGGPTTHIDTYGELVTSVINPSHRISQRYLKSQNVQVDGVSTMRTYNDVMTVTELIDLTAFLQDQYDLYPGHPPPPY